jgi:hypothetical protein|tara:strand:+ start:425 stop:529 length:105 start_codon:yes stop_codon:yes gene_type:complete
MSEILFGAIIILSIPAAYGLISVIVWVSEKVEKK